MSLFLVFSLTITYFFINIDNQVNLLIIILSFSTIFHSFKVIDYFFQSKVLSKYIIISNIICLFISSLIKLLLIKFNFPLIYFGTAVVFESLITGIAYIIVYYKYSNESKKWKFDKLVAFNLLKDSWPMIIAGLGYTIYRKIDQVMLFNMTTESEVGNYAVAVKLIDVIYIFPIVIISSIFPYLISIYKNNDLFKEKILLIYRSISFFSIIAILFFYITGGELIHLLYGEAYENSINVFAILIFGILFQSFSHLNGRWILLKNYQIFSMYRTIFGSILNIILNYIFIPKYGINGAAYSTILTLFFSVFLFYFINNKTREIFYIQLKSLISFYKGTGDFLLLLKLNKGNKN